MSLKGIRVVDLTRIIAGPFCTQLLADLGADVIKIETPKGDPLRAQGEKVNDFSWYFAGYNRNKRSVVLDLRQEKALSALREIIRTADVLVENFRPGVRDAMGLTQESLSTLNPDLIVCGISGFGADGPYAQRPAFDFIAQAMSGYMSVTGNEEGAGMRAGVPISDLVVGLYGALSVVSRIAGRLNADASGVQTIDVSLTDSMVSLLSYIGSDYLSVGKEPVRNGNDHPLVAPYGVFETRDSSIALAPANDIVYDKLLKALDLEHLLEDERIDTNPKRMANRHILRDILDPIFKQQTNDFWIEKLNKAGVPVGPILSVPEVFEDPQVKHREMVVDVDHGDERGVVQMLGFPMKFDTDPCEMRHPAPRLGEHSREVLLECGYTDADIDGLVEANVLQLDDE